MKNIAILITTFLRDSALYKSVQSIIDNGIENCIILIADQGYRNDEKTITYDYFKSQMPCEVYNLPFDCGLSEARNFLVNKAKELGCEYCLLTSDSIQFTSKYNFEPIINFLNNDPDNGVVGFELDGSTCPWEYNISVDSKGILLTKSEDFSIYSGISFKKVDICRNIFLAKTNSIIDLWDKEMKLAEHELAFIELKKRNIKVFWTDVIKFKKNNANNSDEYKEYRKRFGDFQKILKQKLNIETWIIYSPEVMQEIKEYQKKYKK